VDKIDTTHLSELLTLLSSHGVRSFRAGDLHVELGGPARIEAPPAVEVDEPSVGDMLYEMTGVRVSRQES
jgi:hypothetical protein